VNAKVSAGDQITYTDAAGHYDLFAPVGRYTVTAAQYGYQAASIRRVTVTQDQATTQDFALTALPTHTVSGTVTDGSGHGWPLYAQITIDGMPGGPIWTDPATGHYSVNLPTGSTYTLRVSASYPGYETKTVQVAVAASDVVADVTVPVDQNTCSAPGYEFHYAGSTQTFDTGQAPAGWSTGNAGTGGGWVFDNPGGGDNTTGGSGDFAAVDSDHDGFGSTEDATLTTPVVDLTTDPTPIVQFAQDFVDGFNDTTTIDVFTNGGHTWTTVDTQNVSQARPTTTAVAIPQAAGKQNVRIRFHYQTQSWTWWWKIDDVYIGNPQLRPLHQRRPRRRRRHGHHAHATQRRHRHQHHQPRRDRDNSQPRRPGHTRRLLLAVCHRARHTDLHLSCRGLPIPKANGPGHRQRHSASRLHTADPLNTDLPHARRPDRTHRAEHSPRAST
jgi:hypothetical protein